MSLDNCLPPGVLKAAKSLENPAETFYENEEELALISLLCCHGKTDHLELVLEKARTGETDDVDDDQLVLFADLEWAKQCGNRAFQAEDWMGALEHYARVLKHNRSLQRETYQPPALPKVEELMVTVHANAAQVLLNLARNDEAAQQCEAALQMSILYDKPALHKKVLHRLEQSRQPPSAKARLAAAEVKEQSRALPPTVTITEETRISFYRFEESEREAVECAFKMAGGNLSLSSALLSVCRNSGRSKSSPDVDSALKLARIFFLEEGIARPLDRGEILHLMELQVPDLGKKIAKQKAEQAEAKQTAETMLDQVIQDCQERIWDECLREDASRTTEFLRQPREWLSSRDRCQAIPYFLFMADRITKIPLEEDKASRNSKDYQANKPNAVGNLRAIVEVAWFQYVGALRQMDLANHGRTQGESYGPSWKDVDFQRKMHKMRLARGRKEPDQLTGAPSSSDLQPDNVQSVDMSADSKAQKTYFPSLEDLTAHRIERRAQIVAVQRGLKILKEAEEEAQSNEYLSFDLRNFVSRRILDKQVASMKKKHKGTPPIVDTVWHLCYHEKQGVPSMMMLELHSIEDLQKSRPACMFVTNRKVACPPPEPYEMQFLRPQEVKMVPKSTIAVQYLSTDERSDRMFVDDIQRVLLKAVEARGGIPKKIAVGPVGTMQLSMKYLHSGGGGFPKDIDVSGMSEDDKYYCEQSEIEAFIDNLGVKEQWIEGIFGELPGDRIHEEQPQKKTPAQHRAQMLKKNRERNSC